MFFDPGGPGGVGKAPRGAQLRIPKVSARELASGPVSWPKVAESAESETTNIAPADIFSKSRSPTAPHGKATGGNGAQMDYLVSDFSVKTRL